MNEQAAVLPNWLDLAECWPVAFAQVREDPRIDLSVLERIATQDASVCMVASGGCTAAAICASSRVSSMHLVDANPAQIALTRLKLELLATADTGDRLAVLGHRPMPAGARAERLAMLLQKLQLPPDELGPSAAVAAVGPDFAGRYEALFARLAEVLKPWAAQLQRLLVLHDGAEQSARVAPATPLGRQINAALDDVMAMPNLVRLFGADATRNRQAPFSCHFADRLRHALATLPAVDNPFVWQMLCGRFPADHPYDWLAAAPPAHMPQLTWQSSPMDVALPAFERRFDLVHLSNILDWLSPEEGAATLRLARSSLKIGGYVVIRQLNSSLEISALDQTFQWLPDLSVGLHAGDRSFFYRALHVGRRR